MATTGIARGGQRGKRTGRWVVAGAVLSLVLLLGGVLPAHAPGDLPPIGAEIPQSVVAVNTSLRLTGADVSAPGLDLTSKLLTGTVDFRGGLKHRVDVNPDDPTNSVRLRLVGLRISGEPSGTVANLAGMTIEQGDIDVDAPSRLRITQRFPLKYEVTEVFPDLYLSLDLLGGAAPLTLQSMNPMVLRAAVTQFPPRSDSFTLEAPVQFALADSHVPLVILQKMTAKQGAL
jgi:hypothetical protein